MTRTEKFEVRNRWTNDVQFTAEISVTPDMPPSVKLGLAVRWGRANDADLSGADLSGADLSRADLSRADLSGAVLRGADLRGAVLRGADLSRAVLRGAALSGADLRGAVLRGADLRGADLRGAVLRGAALSGADLRGADLRGADLRSFKADLWMILTMARHEVPALVRALQDGKVDGSTYEGECACLVGTLENAGASGLPRVTSGPAEQWFTMIRKGDKPGDGTGGGFAATKALEWAREYCDLTGIALPAPPTTHHQPRSRGEREVSDYRNNPQPIKDYHVAFARAVVALAREHGVGQVKLSFRRASSAVFRKDFDQWDQTEVSVDWHEGRHGDQSPLGISFRAEATARVEEQEPTTNPAAEEM